MPHDITRISQGREVPSAKRMPSTRPVPTTSAVLTWRGVRGGAGEDIEKCVLGVVRAVEGGGAGGAVVVAGGFAAKGGGLAVLWVGCQILFAGARARHAVTDDDDLLVGTSLH